MTQPGILHVVGNMGGEYYVISQVAEMVGRHPDTIRSWIRKGAVSPPRKRKRLGEKGYYVWLFTPDLVQEYKEYASTVRPGRKPYKTAGQKVLRKTHRR